jgi:hypothetical protein
MNKLKIILSSSENFGVLTTLAVLAYFNNTWTFMLALLIAFMFNVIAGLRADEVKMQFMRIWPVVYLKNFRSNKFVIALFEFVVILVTIILLKVIADLMLVREKSVFVFQYLTWIALYYYLRNTLRNLSKIYPKVGFFRAVYHIISFKFGEFFGKEVKEIIDNEDKDN